MKDDDKAFIFTLKNPHGVEPTRFMKKETSSAIYCDFCWGPYFLDIAMKSGGVSLNKEKKSDYYIDNNGKGSYECHPEYKSSLYVNTGGPDETNFFSLLDFEVFAIDYENRENINKLCKYPDIIWEYINTKDISEESLKKLDDNEELLNDLDTINCNDSKIRAKISRCCFKNPSEFLPNSQLVDMKYDVILREWLGNDYKWKLLYRASEHGYSGNSFHYHCDNIQGPTMIVIKSDGGWIFGGYTTQSWCGNDYFGIYNDMI